MSNIYSQNIIRKKNIELTIRKIFEIKQKTNEFNNVILNELSGYQDIFYLKNKKIFQFFLQKKKKQELDLLKNYEIIFGKNSFNSFIYYIIFVHIKINIYIIFIIFI